MGPENLSTEKKIVKNGLPYACSLLGVVITLGNPMGAAAGFTAGTLLGLMIRPDDGKKS